MENTKISWCDNTVNLWIGCSKINEACKNCYAEKISNRFGDDVWGEDKQRKFVKSAFENLDKYQKKAEKQNKKVKVFIGSMMDIFEDDKKVIDLIRTTNDLRKKLFINILFNYYPNLIFLFLTKRPENIIDYIPFEWRENQPDNVWFGVSVFNEESAFKSREILINSKLTKNIFYSIEPQLEPINNIDLRYVDWVIQGGESGQNNRHFKLEWAERMRNICKEQNTPYFFKQIDGKKEIPEHLNFKEYPEF